MSDRWKDMLWEAVNQAHIERAEPKEVLIELRQCWAEVMRQEAKRTDKILREAVDRP